MSELTLKHILESIIMVSETPITAAKLCALVDDEAVTTKEVKAALNELEEDYQSRGVRLVKVASGFRFQAHEHFQPWFSKLFEEKPPRYSRALLETLAIIAYRQPVTRADVEAIRGVAVSSNIMRTLLEREWVKVVGHREVPGKPAIYATTKQFLDYFNLEKLDDLPTLAEIKDMNELLASEGSESNEGLKLEDDECHDAIEATEIKQSHPVEEPSEFEDEIPDMLNTTQASECEESEDALEREKEVEA